ncbi:MAG: endonuclease/exonuclease/phosphatase family protein, partial [Verrucomicrobia bacterium]|nr:endonuclease/exonuclease/phosphatase family protein [Verrucomicrobiota bacterium]
RGLLQVELEVGGRRLVVMNTHLDYRPQDDERLANVREISGIAGDYPGTPLIVCGDFNAVPGSPTHMAMKGLFDDAWEAVGADDGFTYSSTEPRRRIDYIYFRRGADVVPVKAWVPVSLGSDHLPLVVEFKW